MFEQHYKRILDIISYNFLKRNKRLMRINPNHSEPLLSKLWKIQECAVTFNFLARTMRVYCCLSLLSLPTKHEGQWQGAHKTFGIDFFSQSAPFEASPQCQCNIRPDQYIRVTLILVFSCYFQSCQLFVKCFHPVCVIKSYKQCSDMFLY